MVPFTSPCLDETAERQSLTQVLSSESTGYPAQLAKLVSFKGTLSSNKVLLQWAVNENETTDQFEIQKSMDGKNFSTAALVFGTDRPETDFYQFYEKVNSKKAFYRVKLINKDQKTEYSTVIEVDPAKKIQS